MGFQNYLGKQANWLNVVSNSENGITDISIR